VTIGMSHCAQVDQDVLEIVEEFEKGATKRGITLELLHLPPGRRSKPCST